MKRIRYTLQRPSSQAREGASTQTEIRLSDRLSKPSLITLTYRSSFYDTLKRPQLALSPAQSSDVHPLSAPLFGRTTSTCLIPPGTDKIFLRTDQPLEIEECTAIGLGNAVLRSIFSNFGIAWGGIIKALRSSSANTQLALALNLFEMPRYHHWRISNERLLDVEGLDKPRSDWQQSPHLCFVVQAPRGYRGIPRILTDLQQQPYPAWSVLLDCEDTATLHSAGASSSKGHVDAGSRLRDLCLDRRETIFAPMPHSSRLPFYAAAVLAEYFASREGIFLAYGDEDQLGPAGRYSSPRLKPDWSPEFERSRGYLGSAVYLHQRMLTIAPHLCLSDLRSAGQVGNVFFAAPTSKVGHIRRIMLTTPPPMARESALLAGPLIAQSSPKSPSATIVIPTKDRHDLLVQCLTSLAMTSHQTYDLVIVDNGSTDPSTLALYATLRRDHRISIIDAPGRFNYSALCNTGAEAAKGVVIAFLNNDTEILECDWLTKLVTWAVRPTVGAVGCRLAFPSGRLQHSGVVVGLGGYAGHSDWNAPGNYAGYLERARAVREVSAVTGACLAVEKVKLDAVGGFDSKSFPVELSDVDLCLRLAHRGWKAIYLGDTALVHHESASRGRDVDRETIYAHEHAEFTKRWSDIILDDPHFHPSLSLFKSKAALA
jgi:GT2 family glycosyltransferase